MTDISEDDIRARAYALWEAAGSPDGSHEEHWQEALRQLTAEAEEAQSANPPKLANASKLSVVENDAVTEPVSRKRTKIA